VVSLGTLSHDLLDFGFHHSLDEDSADGSEQISKAGLRQLGDSTWAATGLSGTPQLGSAGVDGFGNLMSSTIERSNVDITEELVNLIAAQRNFQANAKAIETANSMDQSIINLRS